MPCIRCALSCVFYLLSSSQYPSRCVLLPFFFFLTWFWLSAASEPSDTHSSWGREGMRRCDKRQKTSSDIGKGQVSRLSLWCAWMGLFLFVLCVGWHMAWRAVGGRRELGCAAGQKTTHETKGNKIKENKDVQQRKRTENMCICLTLPSLLIPSIPGF